MTLQVWQKPVCTSIKKGKKEIKKAEPEWQDYRAVESVSAHLALRLARRRYVVQHDYLFHLQYYELGVKLNLL